MTQHSDLGPVPHSSSARAAARASWGWTVARGVEMLVAEVPLMLVAAGQLGRVVSLRLQEAG